MGRGLGKLVLTLIELIRHLMERQALRRVEAGDLPDEKVEHFWLRPEDPNIDLGPLGNPLPRDPDR